MDFDLRQWLLILGPLLVVGVLLHGYFRMRSSQNEIKMNLDKSFLSKSGEEPADDDIKMLKAELPNGGARVVESKKRAVFSEDDDRISPGSAESPLISTKLFGESTDSNMMEAGESISESSSAAVGQAEPEENGISEKAAAFEQKLEKLMVMHVLALDTPFVGRALVDILIDSGMHFGDMDIFHFLDEEGVKLFSLASAVEPGTFSLSSLEHFSTPGVTLFMRVHEVSQPLKVFESMLFVANAIAQKLSGDVRDETRSVMTPQTIEHCRESISDFLFKNNGPKL